MSWRRVIVGVPLALIGLLLVGVLVAGVIYSQASLPSPDEVRDRIIGIIEHREERSGVTASCAPRAEEEAVDCLLRDAAGNRGWGTADIDAEGEGDDYVEHVRYRWDFPLGPDGAMVTELDDPQGDGSRVPAVVYFTVSRALQAVGVRDEMMSARCPPVAVGATVVCPVERARHPIARQVTVELTRLAADRVRMRAVVPLPP